MATQRYLAFDLGAESGRGILAQFDGERLALAEAGRFVTNRGDADLRADGIRRWDIQRIRREIMEILHKVENDGPLSGVGADTWGVDFGLLDEHCELIEDPVQYRDPANAAAQTELLRVHPREELWEETGIQPMPFNTLFQLHAIKKRDSEILKKAHRLLFMPDLLHHFLTDGSATDNESTISSTSQMLNPSTRVWNKSLIERTGLPTHFLNDLISPGTRVGTTSAGTPVFVPGGHDTASAVAAVPADRRDGWAFLSSGTWSLLGMERSQPELSLAALNAKFSNEGGVGSTTRLLKNIMGLWLVQECRRCLKSTEGVDYSYQELTQLASEAPAGGPLFDAAHHRFLAPSNMIDEIRAACSENGQQPPGDTGSLIRTCLESLALAYRTSLRNLEEISGSRFDTLYIVGGGTQNKLLNQWAADACGIPVVTGAPEATALGNVLAQLVGAGAVGNWDQARAVARKSFPTETYTPDPEAAARWDERAAVREN